jgi:hypothetical protein
LIVPHMERIKTHHKTPSRFVITGLGVGRQVMRLLFPPSR